MLTKYLILLLRNVFNAFNRTKKHELSDFRVVEVLYIYIYMYIYLNDYSAVFPLRPENAIKPSILNFLSNLFYSNFIRDRKIERISVNKQWIVNWEFVNIFFFWQREVKLIKKKKKKLESPRFRSSGASNKPLKLL